VYTIANYGAMIADHVRMGAYAQALRETIRPGAVVVDIGCGTGILSLLACQRGARRVYAIEPDASIELARTVARDNGYADRIVFLQDRSLRVSLPERADVIVSDLRGRLPLSGGNLASIADARRRFLAPGGRLIPQRDSLWAALVDAPELYKQLAGPWRNAVPGIDLEPALRLATNYFWKGRVAADQVVGQPQCWASLDYRTVENTAVRGEAKWTIPQDRTVHGLVLWFDAELTDHARFSNAPGQPSTIYNRVFLGWPQPVALNAGDDVAVAWEARPAGEDYLWNWQTSVRSGAEVKASFPQSNVSGAALPSAQLRKRSADYVPVLDEDGRIDQFILSRMDGKTSQAEIARRVAEQFPARFAGWKEALTRVGELSQENSR